jgi:hypothetical protein
LQQESQSYVRVDVDEHGNSFFVDETLALTSNNFSPPTPPVYLSSIMAVGSVAFFRLPSNWDTGWHRSPMLQWLVCLEGSVEIETTLGGSRVFHPGAAILLADINGKGHRSTALGNAGVAFLSVQFENTALVGEL